MGIADVLATGLGPRGKTNPSALGVRRGGILVILVISLDESAGGIW